MIDYMDRVREREELEQQMAISRQKFERFVMFLAVVTLIAMIFI